MNYLRSFLEEKKRAEEAQAPTDKTDKTCSVSFVSQSWAGLSTSRCLNPSHLKDISRCASDMPPADSPILDLVAISDAIAAQPRSPFLNDLALSRAARVTVEAARLIRTLPEVARREALGVCALVSRQAADAIKERDYERAYHMLDALPDKLKIFVLQ